MEEKKGKLKLIHIILLGCIFVIGIICGVIYANNAGQNVTSEIKEAQNQVQSEIIEVSNANIKEENKEYFSKEIEVPKTSKVTKKENCKNELILKDSKIDNDKLILKFELNTKNNPIKNIDNIVISDCSKLEIGNEIYYLNKAYTNVLELIEIKENLYEIYALYDVEGLKYDKTIKFTGNIDINELEEYFSDVDTKLFEIGNWNIELPIDEKMKTDCDEKYSFEGLTIKTVENKNYGGENYELLKARLLENNVLINGLLLGYTTEPGILYTIELFDEDGKSLMLNGKEQLIGGVCQDILLKKFDLDSEIKIKFEVSVYGEDEILSQGEKSFKILDYTKKVKEARPNIKTAYNKDLSLVYDSTKFEINTNNSLVEVEYEDLKYPINSRYITNYEFARDITINKYENIFNESLDEIFENRQKLLELGIYGERKEEYTLGVEVGPYDEWGNPDDVKFYEFTDAEIMDIYNGKTVTKDDIKFDKETYIKHSKDNYGYEYKYKNFGEVTVDGKKAITYVIETNDFADRCYILIENDYIYEIHVPTDLKLEADYYEFVNNITFK